MLLLQPLLREDWLSFTSRPWVQGPVDAFLNNPKLTQLSAKYPNLRARILDVIQMIDQVLLKPQQATLQEQPEQRFGPGGSTSSSLEPGALSEPAPAVGNGPSAPGSAHIDWWVHVMDLVTHHGAIYSIIDAMEQLISEDKIARLEGLSSAAITRVSGVTSGVTGPAKQGRNAKQPFGNTLDQLMQSWDTLGCPSRRAVSGMCSASSSHIFTT